jgi:hypothetical protein
VNSFWITGSIQIHNSRVIESRWLMFDWSANKHVALYALDYTLLGLSND